MESERALAHMAFRYLEDSQSRYFSKGVRAELRAEAKWCMDHIHNVRCESTVGLTTCRHNAVYAEAHVKAEEKDWSFVVRFLCDVCASYRPTFTRLRVGEKTHVDRENAT